MTTVIFIFIVALMITGFSTPWVRRLAIWIGFVDAPAQRKLHSTPMPLMGGVAIFAGATSAALLLFLNFPTLQDRSVRGILLAGLLIAVIGLIDDRYPLRGRYKLLGQLLGGVILILFEVHVKLPIPLWLNYTITLLWLVTISNAINFLDNMDGLSAGLSAVSAAFILLLGALNRQFLVAGLAAAVLGACLGFLRYNFKPAKIFMGDAGALFLGFLLAILSLQLRFPNSSNVVTWMVPPLILGIPLFDISLVVFSRLRRGVHPNTAGKDHSSHRLVNMGFSQREAVLILYLLAGCLGMVAIFITQADILEGLAIGGTVALTALYAIWRLDNPR